MNVWSQMSRGARLALVASALAVGSGTASYAVVSGGTGGEGTVVTTPAVVPAVEYPTESPSSASPRAVVPSPSLKPAAATPPAKSAISRKQVAAVSESDPEPTPEPTPAEDAETAPSAPLEHNGRTRSAAPPEGPRYTDLASCVRYKSLERCAEEFPDEAPEGWTPRATPTAS